MAQSAHDLWAWISSCLLLTKYVYLDQENVFSSTHPPKKKPTRPEENKNINQEDNLKNK